MTRRSTRLLTVAGLWSLGQLAVPNVGAAPAVPRVRTQDQLRRPPYRLLLLQRVPQAAEAGVTARPRINADAVRRMLSLFLGVYQVQPVVERVALPSGFPDQIRLARARGAAFGAIAVVWSEVLPSATPGGMTELYLHLLDRVSDKTVVKTLKFGGRLGPDLSRTISLKIWSLLRAALLEVGAGLQQTPQLAKLAGVYREQRPRPRPRPRPAPRPVVPRRPSPHERPRVGLEVGYTLGFYGAGELVHHGVGLSVDLWLLRWLGLYLNTSLYGPLHASEQEVSLALSQTKVGLGLLLGVRWGPMHLRGALGCSLMVLDARATREALPPWHRAFVDPAGSLALQLAWQPVARFRLFVSAGVDVLG